MGHLVGCRLELSNLDATYAVATLFAETVLAGSIVGISGPLGVGKTEFVRAVIHSLTPTIEVSSPTFVLECRYPISSKMRSDLHAVHHWDFYRVGEQFDLRELLEGANDPSRVTLIEWPERVPALVPMLNLKLTIMFDPRESGARILEVSGKLSDEFVNKGRTLPGFTPTP